MYHLKQSGIQSSGCYKVAVRIGLQNKVCVMCNLVKGNLGLTTSMHSARVTLNTSMSWSMGLHAWDGMRDFSREPHVMWDAVRLRIHICTCALRAHLLSVRERIHMHLCFAGHLEKHWTHCLLVHRLALPFQWHWTTAHLFTHVEQDATQRGKKILRLNQRESANSKKSILGSFSTSCKDTKIAAKRGNVKKKIKIQFY